MKDQPKNTIEESIFSIKVALIMLILSFTIEMIYLLKINYDFVGYFSNYLTDIPNHLYFYFFTSIILILYIRYTIYNYQKKLILKFGSKHSGNILNFFSNPARISRMYTAYYSYKVLLEDGRTIYTLSYSSGIVSKKGFRTCTVYEYKGKFVFCDFK